MTHTGSCYYRQKRGSRCDENQSVENQNVMKKQDMPIIANSFPTKNSFSHSVEIPFTSAFEYNLAYLPQNKDSKINKNSRHNDYQAIKYGYLW